jgi:hypothetical protein
MGKLRCPHRPGWRWPCGYTTRSVPVRRRRRHQRPRGTSLGLGPERTRLIGAGLSGRQTVRGNRPGSERSTARRNVQDAASGGVCRALRERRVVLSLIRRWEGLDGCPFTGLVELGRHGVSARSRVVDRRSSGSCPRLSSPRPRMRSWPRWWRGWWLGWGRWRRRMPS